ncbi:MAG: polysaccharide pyruvyl transferase family protein [Clostridia bacterium]
MKVCIITVYNTENCGSFWQAYALADVIEKMGHSVSFLYRSKSDTSQSFKSHLHESLTKASKLNFLASALVWKRSSNYKKAQNCFNVIKEGSAEFNSIDLFVIGSDTVWNFASGYFMRHKDTYTGKRLGEDKCITYAATAANTPYETFEKNCEIKDAIKKLKAISVRDEETYFIIKKLTGKEPTVVCDPTMLTERTLFDNNAKEISDKNYILLYHFAPIPECVKNEILDLKKKHNLKVISFGEHRFWCDKTICYDPYSFVSYLKNASFVVTDTFHGTIFSILYEKNFAEFGNVKKKISDLLSILKLTNSVVGNENTIEFIYENGLDYTSANEKINALRQASLLYLKENLLER